MRFVLLWISMTFVYTMSANHRPEVCHWHLWSFYIILPGCLSFTRYSLEVWDPWSLQCIALPFCLSLCFVVLLWVIRHVHFLIALIAPYQLNPHLMTLGNVLWAIIRTGQVTEAHCQASFMLIYDRTSTLAILMSQISRLRNSRISSIALRISVTLLAK